MFNKETLIFFLSSVLVFGLSYFNIVIGNSQLVLTLFLLILFIFINRTFLSVTKIASRKWYRPAMLFFGACIVQFLVVTTGGLYSPVLILLPLYTLGISFFMDSRPSMYFLLFSLFALCAHIAVDETASTLFQEDPWSAVLYVISFLIIMPLIHLLIHTYRLKDVISKALIDDIQLKNLREESILAGLTDFVIVTTIDLHILYANESFLRAKGFLMKDVFQRKLLDVLPIKDEAGTQITKESLQIDTVVEKKSVQVFNNVYTNLTAGHPTRTILQIRPIVDLEGAIHQLAFVLTNAQISRKHSIHTFLEQSRMRHQILVEEFKKMFTLAKDRYVLQQIELYGKIEDDLLTAMEIEDHPIKEIKEVYDVTKLVRQVVEAKRDFSQVLGVQLLLADGLFGESSYKAKIDSGWINLLLRKLLDIAILLAYTQEPAAVELSLEQTGDGINVYIKACSQTLTQEDTNKLFVQYYDDLGIKTALRLGSGLEGFIVKTIITELNIGLSVTSGEKSIRFTLPLPKAT